MDLLSPALLQLTVSQDLGVLPLLRKVGLVLAVHLLPIHDGLEVVVHCLGLVFILDFTLVQVTLAIRLVLLHLQSGQLSHLTNILIKLSYGVDALCLHLFTLFREENEGDLLFLLCV